jgi:hypothetical protein
MPKIQITHSCQIPSKHLTNFVSLHVNANKRTTCITINKYIYTYMHTYIHIYKLKKLKTYKIKIKQKKKRGVARQPPPKVGWDETSPPQEVAEIELSLPTTHGGSCTPPPATSGGGSKVALRWLLGHLRRSRGWRVITSEYCP